MNGPINISKETAKTVEMWPGLTIYYSDLVSLEFKTREWDSDEPRTFCHAMTKEDARTLALEILESTK